MVAVVMCWSLAVLLYPPFLDAVFRKLQVYESSLSDALLGGISDKERVLLDTLRDTLGISPADSAMLEKDLIEGRTR